MKFLLKFALLALCLIAFELFLSIDEALDVTEFLFQPERPHPVALIISMANNP